MAAKSKQHKPGGLTCNRAETSSRCKAAVKGNMPAPWARTVKLRRVREVFHWGCTGCKLDGGTFEADPLTVALLPSSANVVMLKPAATLQLTACCSDMLCTDFCQHCYESNKVLHSARFWTQDAVHVEMLLASSARLCKALAEQGLQKITSLLHAQEVGSGPRACHT